MRAAQIVRKTMTLLFGFTRILSLNWTDWNGQNSKGSTCRWPYPDGSTSSVSTPYDVAMNSECGDEEDCHKHWQKKRTRAHTRCTRQTRAKKKRRGKLLVAMEEQFRKNHSTETVERAEHWKRLRTIYAFDYKLCTAPCKWHISDGVRHRITGGNGCNRNYPISALQRINIERHKRDFPSRPMR